MELQILPRSCPYAKSTLSRISIYPASSCFVGKTDEETSLVCAKDSAPEDCIRDDGWRAFRVAGDLDFSLVGIIAGISAILTETGISIFVVSTYNTDYVLVKEEKLAPAAALRGAGYEFAG